MLHLFIPPSWLNNGNHLSFYYVHNFSFSSISYSLKCIVYSLPRLAPSLRTMHISFLYVFSWLETHFLLAINTILVSVYTTTYLSICLPEDIFVASKFLQLPKKKCCENIVCKLLCECLFVVLLDKNARQHDCWIAWKKYV